MKAKYELLGCLGTLFCILLFPFWILKEVMRLSK